MKFTNEFNVLEDIKGNDKGIWANNFYLPLVRHRDTLNQSLLIMFIYLAGKTRSKYTGDTEKRKKYTKCYE